MPQVLNEAPRVTRDEGRAEAEVPEAEEEAGRAVLLPAAARRVLGRTGSLGSALADAVRRVGALVMLRTVAVEALVLMEEMEVSREESVSWSDCIDSLRRDVDTCDASELLGALVVTRDVLGGFAQLAARHHGRKAQGAQSLVRRRMGEQLAIDVCEARGARGFVDFAVNSQHRCTCPEYQGRRRRRMR